MTKGTVMEKTDISKLVAQKGNPADAVSKTEFLQRWAKSVGVGPPNPDFILAMPCPACAAPEFIAAPVMVQQQAWEKGATCQHCHRTIRLAVKEGFDPMNQQHFIDYNLVLVSGDDLPAWMPPKAFRREGEAANDATVN